MCNFYIMFYTDSSDPSPGSSCMNDQVKYLTGKHFPKDVSEPLPPNPALEEEATGHHHHHAAMAGSQDEDTEEQGEIDQVHIPLVDHGLYLSYALMFIYLNTVDSG